MKEKNKVVFHQQWHFGIHVIVIMAEETLL